VLPISGKYEWLFNSYKILLEDRRSRLKMDIIKANKYLRPRHRPPIKGIFNNKDIGKAEGKEQDPQEAELSLKGQAKARLAAAVAAEAAAQEDAAAGGSFS
jgi:hypothetical protein